MPRSRRALLKAAGLTLTGGTLTASAGCLSNASTSSDTTQTETPTPEAPTQTPQSTGTAAIDFRQWLPDPATTALRDGYGFQYFDVATIRATRDAFHDSAYRRLEAEMLSSVPDRFVDVADVDATLRIDFTMNLALGSFDPDAVSEKITSERRSQQTASTATTPTPEPTPEPELTHYRGFDLYGTRRIFAVSENAVMAVTPMGRDGDPLALTKAFLDSQAGETGQYVASNEYAKAMLGLIDDPHAVWCYPEAMDGSTSRGFRKDSITGGLKAWRFDSKTTHLTFANTYPDAQAAETAALADYIDAESARFGSYDGLNVKTEGRIVWTDGTIPTNEFDHLSAGGPGDSVTTPN